MNKRQYKKALKNAPDFSRWKHLANSRMFRKKKDNGTQLEREYRKTRFG